MSFTYFAVLVVLAGLMASGRSVVQWQVVWCLFGGSAAVILTAVGGASVTPAVAFVPFLFARALKERRIPGLLRHIAFPSAGFWLAALVGWGVFSAIVLPRLFRGAVYVLNVNRFATTDMAATLYPLAPGSGNITQAGYALISLAVFVATRALLTSQIRVDAFRNAVLLLAGLNLLAGTIDILIASLNLPNFLDLVRNANYAMTNQTLAGLKRVAGTFAETSTFSAFTLPLFAFSFSLWLSRDRSRLPGWIAVGSLLFLIRSTSTTAYVGLAGYLACIAAMFALSAIHRGRIPRFGSLLLVIGVSGTLAGLIVLLDRSLFAKVLELVNTTIFDKLNSESGLERSLWNKRAWMNFLDTFFVGVGLGSARASSYPLVILANLGMLGAFFYLCFLSKVFRGMRAAVPSDRIIRNASQHAVLAILISATVSAAVFDLGVLYYCFAAAATLSFAQPKAIEPVYSPT